MFWEVLDWKRRLLVRLDRGVLNACEWEAFIRAAMRVGCPNVLTPFVITHLSNPKYCGFLAFHTINARCG